MVFNVTVWHRCLLHEQLHFHRKHLIFLPLRCSTKKILCQKKIKRTTTRKMWFWLKTKKIKKTTTLTGTLAPAGTTNKTVWWTSANPTIATVNAQGVVIGVQAGVVNIYGTSVDGSFVGTSVITVT